ncbi:Cytochrome P450 2G1 like protein [Argiope bruennichi]|uniref:Cytochrome P450 2G1 like protein n=1 Tax=Argiope bruennichi TaxID=94029 RepID=A0A8T0FWB7_ARGBR|nr:Cytochrome P450 2G1 like protein [Argiope bruennichi]
MEVFTLVILTVLIVLVSLWQLTGKSSKNSLPGPIGFPIIGSLVLMTKKPFIKFTELSKIYGPLYRIKVGSRNVLVITDFEIMKEAFLKDEFMGRSPDLNLDLSEDSIRTGAINEMPWKEQRRFSLHMLRDLGFGKTRMEEHIKEEIIELLQRISEYDGKPVKHSYLLEPSMSNNVSFLVFGKRLKYNDPERENLDRFVREVARLIGATSWQVFFPWLGAFMRKFKLGQNGELSKLLGELKEYIRKELKQHEETLDPNNIRDFMDGYLLEIQKKSHDPNTTFKKEVLVDLSRALFGAGSETVRVTVDWALLACAAYPEVQKKIHTEIDEVLGSERFPTWQDRINMPFTEAVLAEVMRWKTIAPLNLTHYTLEDTELRGYFIPKHTLVVGVLWSLDNDEKLWGEDVQEFKPERFLSPDGRKFIKPEYAIPFSVGKRDCPGKSLAQIENF